MLTEQRILRRLSQGARVIHDRNGISFDLPGQGMMWSKHSFIAQHPALVAALQAVAASGSDRARVQIEKPLAVPSAGLAAMLSEMGHRA